MNSILFSVIILLGYAILVWSVMLLFTKKTNDKDGFLVANRYIGKWQGAFSIAASWIWAPALFVASQKAYQQGVVGLFWFLVPNVLCLIIFAYFANIIRKNYPEGYTLSKFMEKKYSNRTQKVYLLQLSALAICSTAVQLLAGGFVISAITGVSFVMVTFILSIIALSYSLFSGIKGSILTDYFQMFMILGIGGISVFWILSQSGGIAPVISGLGGSTGEFTNLFDANGWMVFLTFGLSTTIGLLSGPFGDQSFWQRGFSIKEHEVKSAFIWGALVFGIVPLVLSLLGFSAAGNGFVPDNVGNLTLEYAKAYLPIWALIPFSYMLLSGLVSTVDSNLCAMSSFASDFIDNDKQIVKWSKIIMIVVTGLGILIANIPGMSVLYLFMFYGSLRASTLMPTVLTLISKKQLSERGVFWGIVLALLIGLPVFAYGNYFKVTPMIWGGSLLIIVISAMSVLLFTYYEQKKNVLLTK